MGKEITERQINKLKKVFRNINIYLLDINDELLNISTIGIASNKSTEISKRVISAQEDIHSLIEQTKDLKSVITEIEQTEV